MKVHVSIFFGVVSCIYWLGLQGQQADLVVPDYTIIFHLNSPSPN